MPDPIPCYLLHQMFVGKGAENELAEVASAAEALIASAPALGAHLRAVVVVVGLLLDSSANGILVRRVGGRLSRAIPSLMIRTLDMQQFCLEKDRLSE